MKAYSSNDIKQELASLPPKKVAELLLRLVRFKKENKELLSYLLFQSHHLTGYIDSIKAEMEEAFAELPKPGWYHTTKALRKILRWISKHSKYTGSKEAEAEWRIHFCKQLKQSTTKYLKVNAIATIYQQQLKKIEKLLPLVHEDLQYDLSQQLKALY